VCFFLQALIDGRVFLFFVSARLCPPFCAKSAHKLQNATSSTEYMRGMASIALAAGLLSLCVPAFGLYRDGYEVIETGPGGFFGAVLDEESGTAWFGVDDAPTRVVRVNLNTMAVTGKLELNADEQRLWCFVKHGNYGYLGVEAPGGRLVGIDLQKMERLGYATASQFPLLAGVVVGPNGYFSAGSNPATVMRLHLKQMQDGGCADWSQCRFEVALNQGEEAVRSVFADKAGKHLYLAMYTSPGRIVKMTIPDMTRVKHLDLHPAEEKILCGTSWIGKDPTVSGGKHREYGIFGTATSPGRLIKVDLETMTRVGDSHFIDGEDRPATIVVHGRHGYIGFGSAWAEGTSSVLKVDLERMVRVAAVITRQGQTWLYTGLGYKNYAFYGTRGTATSKHATIVRINTNPTFPGIPVPPVYNSSGSGYIELNWLREYPEYHNGGAPIIGARVLLRPSDHHDWTAEHVYGYAAPDPAAPKDRIKRVHEEPVELEDHGCV